MKNQTVYIEVTAPLTEFVEGAITAKIGLREVRLKPTTLAELMERHELDKGWEALKDSGLDNPYKYPPPQGISESRIDDIVDDYRKLSYPHPTNMERGIRSHFRDGIKAALTELGINHNE